MKNPFRRILFSVVWLLFACPFAHGDNPVSWTILEEVLRTDTMKTWTSPTGIDLGKMVWAYEWEITKVTGTVNVPVIGNVTQDITGDLPPEDRMGAGETRSLPAVLLDQAIVEETTGMTANLRVEIDALGFGQAVFSDIMLGSIVVPLFGSRPIERINVEATVMAAGYDFGDYNRDGTITAADYEEWQHTFGQSGAQLRADGNGNGMVDAADYVMWRQHFSGAGGGALAAEGVPEPAGVVLVLFTVGAAGVRWRRAKGWWS
jgi:hypothetical protein